MSNPNPLLGKAYLRNLNLNNLKIIEAMGFRNNCIKVPLNGITSIPNLMKIYQAVLKLLLGDTDRHTGDLIRLLSL
jgi:hypothetical protein